MKDMQEILNSGIDGLQNTKIEDIKDIIKVLEGAVTEHSRWLNAVFRSLICDLSVEDIYLKDDSYRLCKFGRLYYNNPFPILNSNKNFQMIDEIHKKMHNKAYIIVSKAIKKEKPSTSGATTHLIGFLSTTASIPNIAMIKGIFSLHNIANIE